MTVQDPWGGGTRQVTENVPIGAHLGGGGGGHLIAGGPLCGVEAEHELEEAQGAPVRLVEVLLELHPRLVPHVHQEPPRLLVAHLHECEQGLPAILLQHCETQGGVDTLDWSLDGSVVTGQEVQVKVSCSPARRYSRKHCYTQFQSCTPGSTGFKPSWPAGHGLYRAFELHSVVRGSNEVQLPFMTSFNDKLRDLTCAAWKHSST